MGKIKAGIWKDGSSLAELIAYRAYRGPELGPHAMSDGSPLPLIPAPGDLTPSSDLYQHMGAHTQLQMNPNPLLLFLREKKADHGSERVHLPHSHQPPTSLPTRTLETFTFHEKEPQRTILPIGMVNLHLRVTVWTVKVFPDKPNSKGRHNTKCETPEGW